MSCIALAIILMILMFVMPRRVTTNYWVCFRNIMDPPLASLCLCTSVSMHCCWSIVSLS